MPEIPLTVDKMLALPYAVHREIFIYLQPELRNTPEDPQVLLLGDDQERFGTILSLEKCAVAYSDYEHGVVAFLEMKNFPVHTFDVILCNHVLETICDQKLERFFQLVTHALKPQGSLLIRENLTLSTRSFSLYTHFLEHFRAVDEWAHVGYKIRFAQALLTSIHAKQSWSDWLWMCRKAEYPQGEPLSTIKFLDTVQYKDEGIGAYEWIFGKGFISPGGGVQNRAFVNDLFLQPGSLILDVGCGIGGNCFQMAEEYGFRVIGADLSANMIGCCIKKANILRNTQVSFVLCDATEHQFPACTFDAIYSRDAILHIANKKKLFQNFLRWLKPGGRLMFTDYAVGVKEFSDGFKNYLANRQYVLCPIAKFGELLNEVGFESVECTDITDEFQRILTEELAYAKANQEDFIQQFGEAKYKHLTQGWEDKLHFVAYNDQKWALVTAEKSHAAVQNGLIYRWGR